jgi:hypothetical protein
LVLIRVYPPSSVADFFFVYCDFSNSKFPIFRLFRAGLIFFPYTSP